MVKMIIVDDEYIIMESLKTLVDWASVGVEVIGCADNGAAAIDLTLKQKPDIILSDISMPFFSGLEMLEALRRGGSEVEVIFISAYGTFEYAQEALKYGAFDFILKPIQEDQLLKTVERCAKKIHEKKARESEAEASDTAERRDDLLRRLLVSGMLPNAAEQNRLEQYGLSQDKYPYMLVAGAWQEDRDAPPVSADMPDGCLLIPLDVAPNQQALLVFCRAYYLQHMRHGLEEHLLTPGGAYVCVSEALPFPDGFSRMYAQVCLSFVAARLKNASTMFYEDETRGRENPVESFSDGQRVILEYVKSAGGKRIPEALYHLFLFMASDGTIFDLEIVKLRCVELVDYTLRELSDYKLQDYLDNPQKTLSAKKSIMTCASIDAMFDVTKNILVNFSMCVEEIQRHGSKRLIKLAVQYIHENYMSDITLAQTAKHLYVSPAYLSKIFSAEMQEPFSRYLLVYRIGIAKRLLRDTHYKIYEVASQVGYTDVAHFSKSFKQITGVSPNRFRNQD